MSVISIAGRRIGPEDPPYIIAELSGNHNGDIERAFALMRAAKEAGADAVKLQTYTPDTLTIDHDGPGFRIQGGQWHGRTLYDLYGEAQTPWDWHPALFACARDLGLTVFSTPFDASAVEFLETLDVPAYKIASFELIDLDLVRRVAATGRPVIMSTGMAHLGEIHEAVETVRGAGNPHLALLHCVSGYPAPPEDSNLCTIPHLAEAFGTAVGLSDHVLGTSVSVAAIALGACIIEKHVTLARADGGPDASFSLEPQELRDLVHSCRQAWAALGRVNYERKASERDNLQFRRSIYVVQDIAAGEVFDERNIRVIRPGFGLAPKYFGDIVGRTARNDVRRGTPLSWQDVN